jgi:Domain of unknown function (DUF4410)
MNKFSLVAGALMCCLESQAGQAQPAVTSPPIVYVAEFQPVTKKSSGFGPLHAISSGLHAHRADENAAALSRALVASLVKAHFTAQVLPLTGPLPQSGWVVRGVFYSLDEGGHLVSVPFLSSRKSPNVQVTVTLTDNAKNPETPFAIIGTDSVLKGQGVPVGWNPYVVSARFVMHRMEGDKSLNDLADQIAQKIAERSADLISQDAGQP